MVTIFCHRLGWNTLYVLLEHFQSRLLFGVQLELVDLMRLPSMLSHTARLLYDAGLTNVSSVATASPENIQVLLKNACPFQSTKETENAKKLGETDVDAYTLVAEARKRLQLELGVKIQWNDKTTLNSLIPPKVEKLSQEKSLHSPANMDAPSPIEKKSSIKLSRFSSPIVPSPIVAATPVHQKTITPASKTNPSVKENMKPANITPDMFQESSVDTSQSFAVESIHRSPVDKPIIPLPQRTPLSKAVESLRLSSDDDSHQSFFTMKTPQFAACAEKLAPVTEKPIQKCIKRRVPTDDISYLEATPQ